MTITRPFVSLSLLATLFTWGCQGDGPVGPEPGGDDLQLVEGEALAGEGKADALDGKKNLLLVPLLDDDGEALANHNAALKAAGMKTYPLYLVITPEKGREAFSAWLDYADEVYDKLGLDVAMLSYATPDAYVGSYTTASGKKKSMSICYSGDPLQVAGLTESLGDNVFSDQYILWGWKYKQQQGYGTYAEETPEEGYEEIFPDLWQKWRGTGEAVLLVYSTDDDGSHGEAGVVRKCYF